ncbi:unnamed protein product [Rangifer tarandus platyrhynchus]|uniref:Uncharacterized protein n=1 Tax=Rangifer tarandus platyrhynchus TaxID=3082113 RepID=A0ABN8Z6Z9_RANTA|nr:unnamed protein product [Rangifer tarandus platyrhynchus]CAI9688148.1 unnamed protein product [Rangifer tarandus platyrhynchus]
MRPNAQRPPTRSGQPNRPASPCLALGLLPSTPGVSYLPLARRSDVSAPRPRAWAIRSPDSLFASACCEESRPTLVTVLAPRHELLRFLSPTSECGSAHWAARFSFKRGGSDDWLLREVSGGYWWRGEKGVLHASDSLVNLKVGAGVG